MPTTLSRQHAKPVPRTGRFPRWLAAGMAAGLACISQVFAAGGTGPFPVRSRTIEIEYKLEGAGDSPVVELWYTRDRGVTWQSAGQDQDGRSPAAFTAPGEGLYGLILVVQDRGRYSRSAPAAHDSPQTWVFVDSTPPLVQFDRVEPAADFANRPALEFYWTAHDDNLGARPVCLSYQCCVDQTWRTIESSVANTGRYSWTVPADLGGQVTLRLSVRDEGGHVVERQLGPLSVQRFARAAALPDTRPAGSTAASAPAHIDQTQPREATRPAGAPMILVADPTPNPAETAARRTAADLYRQGNWYLTRGQYAVAAERMQEALDRDPALTPAMIDLAGIHYRQQDYDRALQQYQSALKLNERNESALYGAALACVAKRDYHQSREMLTRLLECNQGNAEAWLDLGDVLFMMGDVLTARSHWQRASRTDPSLTEVVNKARRRLELYGSGGQPSASGAAR